MGTVMSATGIFNSNKTNDRDYMNMYLYALRMELVLMRNGLSHEMPDGEITGIILKDSRSREESNGCIHVCLQQEARYKRKIRSRE